MGLAIQITHAVGRQEARFEHRGPDRPIVLGRGAAASGIDVQLPSARIAARQVAIFFQQGRWLTQNLDPRVRVTLNGRPLRSAEPIVRGDVLIIGGRSDPATVVLLAADPQGELPHAPHAYVPHAHDSHDATALAAAAERARSRSGRVSKRAGSSWAVTAMCGVLVTLFAGGTYSLIVRQQTGRYPWERSPPPSVATTSPAPTAMPVTTDATKPSLFGAPPTGSTSTSLSGTASRSLPPAAPTRRITTGDLPAATGPSGADADVDALVANDPHWKRFADLDRHDPAVALYQFEEYLRSADAKPPVRAAVEARRDRLIDALWWRRLSELHATHAKAKADLASFDRQHDGGLLGELSVEETQALQADRKALQDDLSSAAAALADEFGHTPDAAVPDAADEAAVVHARTARDPARFAAFHRRVILNVIRTRGAMAY